jgi:hypothetical protein
VHCGGRVTPWLLLVLAACAGAGPKEPSPEPPAQVTVDNRSSLDMDLYVRRRDQRSRLGFAPANQKTVFALSPALSGGAGLIRLEARPARSSGEAVVSDLLQVRPGDRLDWSIPPQ